MRNLLFSVFLLSSVGAMACTQDFEKYRPGSGGSNEGGQGGGGPCAGVVCNDDNPCTDDVCDAQTGECLFPAATVVTLPQTDGDCKDAICSGTTLSSTPNTSDLPDDDGNPCTNDICDNDTPRHPAADDGTPCNGSGSCLAGVCETCLNDAQCGTDTQCADFTCNAQNKCEVAYSPGTVISGDTDGNCLAIQCEDGNPQPVELPLSTDNDDGNPCTADSCNGTTPEHAALTNMACSNPANGQCNAQGVCVDCTTSAGCAAGDECDTGTSSCVDCLTTAGGCSGSNQCNTTTHTCVDCVDNNGCSGTDQCNTSNNTCVDCVDSNGCPANDQCLVASHSCVDCIDNGGCPDATNNQCNTTTHACVDCVNDSGCSATQNCFNNGCVDCLDDSGCSPGQQCNTSNHTCVDCVTDAGCTAPQQCDTTNHVCVACVTNAACTDPVLNQCDTTNHVCVDCTGDSGCASPTAACDTTNKVCVECGAVAQNSMYCTTNLDGPDCRSGHQCGCDIDGDCTTNMQGKLCVTGNVCGCNSFMSDCLAGATACTNHVCVY
ncbi:MAG: hypothetical protein U0271_00495 [Polyangiaceae bacterium]